MKTLALIVPCYNEAAVLPMFYSETGKVVDSFASEYRTEFVFVDDGSKDDTLRIITNLAQTDPRVKYISFSRNFGKEAAMLAGMDYAVKADYIGIMDADLQHSPELLPVMLEAVDKEGYDVCAARREDREGEARFKSFLSKSFYNVINKISETKINDSAQDFRIMKKKVVSSILSMPEHIRFSKGIFSWVGYNVKWLSHENRERAAGETKWSIVKLFKYAMDGILGYTTTPLKLSFLFSVLFFAGALAEFLFGLINGCVKELYYPVIPYTVAAVFFSAGIITLVLGIIGAYLARVYTEVKNRPVYIISRTNTLDFHKKDFKGE